MTVMNLPGDSGGGIDGIYTSQQFASAANASTQFYWDINGIPLNTFAYAIKTVGGGRAAPPPMRGENQKVPFLPGQTFQAKTPDSRTISLDMWVIGASPDGTVIDEARFDYNLRQLRNLFWNPRKEFVLTKRFRAGTDDTVTVAAGLAQYQQGFSPSMTGRRRADFTVDLFMADPFFYGTPTVISFNAGQTQTFVVPGDWATRAILFDVNGTVSQPQWTNQARTPNQWLRYNNAIASGDKAHIDVKAFKATQTVSGNVQRASGYPTYSGGYFWFELDPGENQVQYSAASGTGTSTLTYQSVWL